MQNNDFVIPKRSALDPGTFIIIDALAFTHNKPLIVTEETVDGKIIEQIAKSPAFTKALFETGNKNIVYKSDNEVWGSPGQNMYGKKLTLIRSSIRAAVANSKRQNEFRNSFQKVPKPAPKEVAI